MLFLHGKHFYLLVQHFFPVKVRTLQDRLDFLERKRQFPEEQNLLQAFQALFVIQPISRLRILRRMQQADLVIILQGPPCVCLPHSLSTLTASPFVVWLV